MSTTITHAGSFPDTSERSRPAYQAYQILHLGFTAAPVLAGFDKFFHFLTNWDRYLAPWVSNLAPIGGHKMMLAVGVIEIIAGILVALRPRVGAPIVCSWLCLIMLNLITLGTYFDLAVRDFGLALAALALWRLSLEFSDQKGAR